MDGYLAREPVTVADSLEMLGQSIDPADLYVVFGSFAGQWQVMCFQEFESSVDFAFDGLKSEAAIGEIKEPVWQSSLDQDDYLRYVEEVRDEIAAGWVYQVNACRLISTESDLDLSHLFNQIQRRHPAPATGYFKSRDWEVASASPETFFRVETIGGKREIITSPIKGTSRDGTFKQKDFAENVMIVDLMRNDLSPLCALGSINVPRLLEVEEHPGLFHLVSDVRGHLRENVTYKEILERLTPAGSISGAPKSSALEVISRFEPYRGAYCGTLGWIHGGRAHFSVLIRTFFREMSRDTKRSYFGTGAGITWGSDPLDEWQETELKAERLMRLARGEMGIRS
jgi:para-aminobenzoate synthetase component 1